MSGRSSKRKKYILKAREHTLKLGNKTCIMGILNITPDSFSNDGLLRRGVHSVLYQADKMVKESADILDVGGESTRPGAKKISMKEEARRVIPVISALAKRLNIPISIDTYKTEVAQRALDAGASIVNNIMGTVENQSLLRMVKNYDAAIVLMHIKGTPRTMQKNVLYKDLIGEIIGSLRKSIENCLDCGIKSDRIIIDPGIGFAKTADQNLEIINNISALNVLHSPILIGTSRKSFIGKALNKDVSQRVMGSAATVCASILNGAHIVRVHDVAPTYDVTRVTDALMQQKIKS